MIIAMARGRVAYGVKTVYMVMNQSDDRMNSSKD